MDVTIHYLWTIGEEQKVAFQQEVATNLTMKALIEMILEGWPDDVKQVSTALREYWLHWAILCIKDGLILKGENLVANQSWSKGHWIPNGVLDWILCTPLNVCQTIGWAKMKWVKF